MIYGLMYIESVQMLNPPVGRPPVWHYHAATLYPFFYQRKQGVGGSVGYWDDDHIVGASLH